MGKQKNDAKKTIISYDRKNTKNEGIRNLFTNVQTDAE